MLLLFNNSIPYSEEFRKYLSLFEIHKLSESVDKTQMKKQKI